MKKFAKLLLLALVVVYVSVGQSVATQDIGQDLMQRKGHMVITLTPPGNPHTGGTGFSVEAPSGKTYTLTNRHVCGLAVNGEMEAHYNEEERSSIIKVIEMASDTDLCLLEALPSMGALHLAHNFNEKAELYVIGHPLLHPLTFAHGYIVDREIIKVGEEKPESECTGRNEKMEDVPNFFGAQRMCVARVDAYDTSIVIYPGNSGSPVFNHDEEVVGVVFAGDRTTNYGAFVPLDVVADFIRIY